jgi:sugar phosphate permease
VRRSWRIAARAVVGLGDAVTFISVLRLVPHWFAPNRVPLVTQLTGICGQLGQVLSAIPFLALLKSDGWTTAYVSVVGLGVLALVLTLGLVKNAPNGTVSDPPNMSVGEVWASVKTVWLRPGTRLGFFTHMGTQFSITVFALMWGLPYLTVAQGLSPHVAGTLLSLSVVVAILAGILIGLFTGRRPHRRSRLVLAIIASNAAIWTIVLALPTAAPLWLLTLLVIVISIGGPGSMVGFDFARTFNPNSTLGTAQGMVNMGGFIASLLVMQAMGLVIGAVGGYSFESFRLAWSVQYVIWAFAVTGILITRKKARRQIREERNLLEGLDAHPQQAAAAR